MDFSTQPTLLSILPGTLLELADPTFDGRSGFRAWVMSSLFRGLGFPRAPAAGCLEDGGPFEVATGSHITFSHLTVLIRQTEPRSPAPTGLLATAPQLALGSLAPCTKAPEGRALPRPLQALPHLAAACRFSLQGP